jgi:uncharacterized membrane protein YfcA
MIYIIGFVIALVIGLTGVGGGTITVPVLILFLHMAPGKTVGTALLFTAAVKLLVAPVYLYRKQVNFRVFALMAAGGLPGLLIGLYFLRISEQKGVVNLVIGPVITITALITVFRTAFGGPARLRRDRARWLPWLMMPIGAEVGFSSAGAGAIGSLALLNLTKLSVPEVAGTDIAFGLTLSLIGGGIQMKAGIYDPAVLTQMVIGGIFGGLLGPNLMRWLPAKPLRVGLCLWLASLGGLLFWRAMF